MNSLSDMYPGLHSAESPPPRPPGSDAESEGGDIEEDSSEMPSDDSCESSQDPPPPQATPLTPTAWDRDMFSCDPRWVRVDASADAANGAVFELEGRDNVRGRRLGTCRPVGATSVKLQCGICKFSTSGDLS